ncbi:alpha/beta-hydrolase family protein [Actinomycetospora sp. C-140]
MTPVVGPPAAGDPAPRSPTRSALPAALLLAVSTYPPMLPRGVVTQLVESAVLLGLGWWLGGWVRWRLGVAGAVATAVWVAVTLGAQDVQRADLGLPVVGWAPIVAVAAAVVLVRRRAMRVVAPVLAVAVLVGLGPGPAVAAPTGSPDVPTVSPVHVAVPLGPGTPEERAGAAVGALERAGGTARRTIVVLVPTGSGWVDEEALATLDAATGGDVATVTVAYDDAPSWVSYLTARDEAVATTDAVLAAVARVAGSSRVLVYGQSLGALAGAQAWAAHPERADGAFWVGPPADTVIGAGGRPVVVLAHPGDPAAVWSPRLLVEPPSRPTGRPWVPVVSFLQTSVDLLAAVGAPAGAGHHYGAEQRGGWDRLLAATSSGT